MKNLSNTEAAKTNEKKRPWPDGTDLDFYMKLNVHKWSYRRWAWEFLRRNRKFIEACKSVVNENADEQAKIIVDPEIRTRV